jgi:hypothetical protein
MSEKEDTVTHITGPEFLLRHQYCLSPADIERDIGRSNFKPKRSYAVCNHPRDGLCGHSLPNDIQLAAINSRLGGKVIPDPELERLEAEKLDRVLDNLVGVDLDKFRVPGLENDVSTKGVKHRGRPRGSRNKSKGIVTGSGLEIFVGGKQ